LTPGSQRTAAFIALAALCALLAWPYLVYLRAPAVGTFHDDGVYLVTAKALATGQGYRILSLPGQPAQTKYPVLFPWLLSLMWRVDSAFPRNLPWLRILPFGATIAWLFLSWRVLRRLGATPGVAAAAIALTAVSPWTVFLSTTLLSETLFAALIVGSLLLVLRIENNAEGRYDAIGAGAIMGAAFLTRIAAIAPAAAGLLVLTARGKSRAAVQYGVSLLSVAAPWIWWSARHASDPVVDPFYSGSNYGSWNIVFNFAWLDKLAVLEVNTLWAIQVGQYWGLIPGSTVAWIVAGVCVPCIIRGAWLMRRSSVTLAFVLYIGLILAWAFPPMRFLVPTLPILVWFLFVGAGPLQPAIGVLAAVLVATSTVATWQQARATEALGGTWFDASGVDDWRGISDLYGWIDTNAPDNAVLIATHDPTFYLFTGRTALRPDSMDPLMLYYNVRGRRVDNHAIDEDFRQRLLRIGADYVVITPRDSIDTIQRLSGSFPGSFTLATGNAQTKHAIYQVDRARLQTQ
jgi:hypothetical protein